MSDLYGFFIVITYIGIMIDTLRNTTKLKNGGEFGLVIGMAIMGVPYALFWPVFYVFLIWFYFSDKK